jgi:hypothetical protein
MQHVLRAISLCGIAFALLVARTSAAPNASVLVVYPMTVSGTADPGAGAQIAALISGDLAATRSVEMREAPPDVSRQAYLETARKLGADYYLSGFVTEVAGELSVVEQLVSTLSNTTVWTNSALLATTADARAQGDLVLDAVRGHAGRALAFSVGPVAPPTVPALSPTPSFAVLLTGGSASENDRAYADAAIVKALRARGFVADSLNDPSGDLALLGPALCAATGAKQLLGGSVALEIQPDREINQWATATLRLDGYDCEHSHSLGTRSSSAGAFNWDWAIDQAVAAALKNVAAN